MHEPEDEIKKIVALFEAADADPTREWEVAQAYDRLAARVGRGVASQLWDAACRRYDAARASAKPAAAGS